MKQFPESAFPHRAEGPSFMARLGITVVLLTAGIGVALALSVA